MREAFDWYVVPVVNVDGYDYTWTDVRIYLLTLRGRGRIHSFCFVTIRDCSQFYSHSVWRGWFEHVSANT